MTRFEPRSVDVGDDGHSMIAQQPHDEVGLDDKVRAEAGDAREAKVAVGASVASAWNR